MVRPAGSRLAAPAPFSPAAYAFIGLIDGQRTVQEILDLIEASPADEAPTQDDVVQVLAQLHAADALQCDVPPDIGELLCARPAVERTVA